MLSNYQIRVREPDLPSWRPGRRRAAAGRHTATAAPAHSSTLPRQAGSGPDSAAWAEIETILQRLDALERCPHAFGRRRGVVAAHRHSVRIRTANQLSDQPRP
jgi:hypothetical protein